MSETPQNTETAAETTDVQCSCGCPFTKRKWLLPLLLLLIVILGGLFAAKDILKVRFSEPYKIASEAVLADSGVIEKLGEPVKVSGFPSGELNDSDCRLLFRVVGPNGEAVVSALGRVRNGVWSFNQLEVAFADGSKTSVEVASEEGGLEEAPAWNPPN